MKIGILCTYLYKSKVHWPKPCNRSQVGKRHGHLGSRQRDIGYHSLSTGFLLNASFGNCCFSQSPCRIRRHLPSTLSIRPSACEEKANITSGTWLVFV